MVELKKHFYVNEWTYYNSAERSKVLEKFPENIRKLIRGEAGIYELTDDFEAIENFFSELSLSKRKINELRSTVILGDLFGNKLRSGFDSELITGYNQQKGLHGRIISEIIIEVFPKAPSYLISQIANCMYHDGALDENSLYRWFALNEMLEHADDKETYGEFVDRNHEIILKKLLELELTEYDLTIMLLAKYKGSVCEYPSVSIPTNIEIFNKFTKRNISTALLTSNRKFKNISPVKLSQLLKEMYESFKIEKIDVPKTIETNLMKAFVNSVNSNLEIFSSDVDMAMLSKDYGFMVETFRDNTTLNEKANIGIAPKVRGPLVTAFYDNPVNKLSISESLLKISEKLSPVELLSILFALGSPASAFRKSSGSSVMGLVEKILKTDDSENFAKFLADLVLEYDGVYASVGEWSKELEMGDIDYSIGIEMVISMMLKGETEMTPMFAKNKAFRFAYADKF